MIEAHGISESCKGCKATLQGKRGWAHLGSCRQRFEKIAANESNAKVNEQWQRQRSKEEKRFLEAVGKEAQRQGIPLYSDAIEKDMCEAEENTTSNESPSSSSHPSVQPLRRRKCEDAEPMEEHISKRKCVDKGWRSSNAR